MSRHVFTLLLCIAPALAPTAGRGQTFTPSVPPPAVSKQAQSQQNRTQQNQSQQNQAQQNPSQQAQTQQNPTQQNPTGAPTHVFTPMHVPPLSPGVLELLKLEGRFSAEVTKGGGRAFASWFADDGVTLNNGQAAVRGRAAIAAVARWDPATYRLSWYAEGAQMMGPNEDAGFTWGHYDAVTVAKDGKSTTKSGRYITFWKKVDGKWRVALDASADEPPFTNGLPTP